MIARQQVDGLSNLELAFQANEIQALFEKNYHTNLSKSAAQALEKESEGWITGLQLSNMAIQQGATNLPRITRASGVGLFEYFAHQILGQQSKEMRDFLLRTSLLGEFDATFCENILSRFTPEPQAWSKLINAVLQKNLFAISVGESRKWIRYHHLFQDFLQTVLTQEEPELADAIFYRLADAYTDQGEWEKAYHIYLELEDFESLGKLVEKAGTSLLQNGRLLTLKSWLDNLPERLRQSEAGLLSLEGIVFYATGFVIQGIALLAQAETLFRAAGNIHGLARTLVRRTTAFQYSGNYAESLSDAEEAFELTKNEPALADINIDAQRSKGLSLYYLGHGNQAVEWLQKALDGYVQHEKTANFLVVLMELGMVYQANGNFEDAQVSYEKAYNIGQETGSFDWMANLLNNLGVLYHLQAKYEKAVQIFEEGLEFAKQSGYIRVEIALLIGLGDLYTDLEELGAAQESYQKAREIIQPANDKFLYYYLMLAEARIARSQKEFDQAHQLLISAQAQIQESDSIYEQGLFHLERGRLAVEERDIHQALNNLQTAKRYFKEDGRTMERTWSQLWLSSVAYQSGNINTARAELQDVLALSRKEAIVHTIGSQVRQVKPWLLGMQKDPVVGGDFSAFMEKIAQNEFHLINTRKKLRRITSTVPLSPPRLSILALGRGQVRINGNTITPSDWKTQSVRELFFYFLTNSKAVSKEQIGLVFWPDIDSAKLKMRFKNDLYRLRRAIGSDIITFENDLYTFNRALDYDYDLDIFENYLERAKNSLDTQEQITYYQAAVDLVRGPYLVDIHATWVWAEREHLNQTYISTLFKLAKLYLGDDSLEKARGICQRALGYDSCLEEIHRLLMKIYSLSGDRAAIAQQYQSCKRTLKDELDISPSEETERLYLQLIR